MTSMTSPLTSPVTSSTPGNTTTTTTTPNYKRLLPNSFKATLNNYLAQKNTQQLFNLLVELTTDDNDDSTPNDSVLEAKLICVCDAVLSLLPNDPDALQVKIITLLRNEKYAEALASLPPVPSSQSKSTDILSQLGFEIVYTLYRNNRLVDAWDVLQSLKSDATTTSNNWLYLEGQLAYRLENYPAAYSIYKQLINNDETYYTECCVNYIATKAAAAQANTLITKDDDDGNIVKIQESESYEVAYNMACLKLSNGDLIGAEALLQEAQTLCQSLLEEDDYTPEEIESELATIHLQLAYIHQLQHKYPLATSLYDSIIHSKPSDIALSAIATNNVLAMKRINSSSDVFELLKKFKQCQSPNLAQKLTKTQLNTIALNTAILNFHLNKPDLARERISQVLQSDAHNATAKLLSALLDSNSTESGKKPTTLPKESLQLLHSQHPDSLFITLSLTQHLITEKSFQTATQLLTTYIDKYQPTPSPALIGLLLWLHSHSTTPQPISTILQKTNLNTTNPAIQKLLATHKLQSGLYTEAVKDFEELLGQSPRDIDVLVLLLKAFILADRSTEIEPYICSLGIDISQFSASGVDTESLEKRILTGRNNKPTGIKMKKQRKRKPILPKNYDPEAQPDPERWLPKYLRSGYKSNKRGKKGAGMKGPQGVVTAGEVGAMGGTGSARIEGVEVESVVTPTAPVPVTAPAPTVKSNANKKKKKGKGTKF